MPVRALEWPVDWSTWRSIQYTFQSSSVEPVSIGFDDGSKLKSALVEPLAGIRISARDSLRVIRANALDESAGAARLQDLA